MHNIQAQYRAQLADKQTRLTRLLQPFFSGPVSIYESPPEHYRMRAEFRIWHEGTKSFHIMFDKTTKSKYTVVQLPAACHLINAAMQRTIALVERNECLRKKLFQIDYLASTNNQLVVSLIYHRPLDDAWRESAESLKQTLACLGDVSIIGRSKKQKVVVGNDHVLETLSIKGRDYTFKQVENSFTQPNAIINVNMIEWVIEHLGNTSGDLLELYCGAGNFSVPLAKHFGRVFATEISKTSVAAAQYNITQNDIDNLIIARLSSEEFTEAYNQTRAFFRLKDIALEEYDFTTVLVDPPRAGLDHETLTLISQFNIIIYISCNPVTLADNLSTLGSTHHVQHLALFDQFPFTDHIETGVILRRTEN